MIKNKIKSLGLLAFTMTVINADENSAQTKATEEAPVTMEAESNDAKAQNLELTKRELLKILKYAPELLERLEKGEYHSHKKAIGHGNDNDKEQKSEDHTFAASIYVSKNENIHHLSTNHEESYNYYAPYSYDEYNKIENKLTETKNKQREADAFMRCEMLHKRKTNNDTVIYEKKQTECYQHRPIPLKILKNLVAELKAEQSADSSSTSSK